jgi:hypothetical protein
MSGQRIGLVSVVVVLVAALIWFARSPTVDVAPTTDESFVSNTQPSVEQETVNEPERETTEVTAALTEAEAEIERLRTELAVAKASAEDEDGNEDLVEPRGYSGRARIRDAGSTFEAELVDASWAPAVESQLREDILNTISDDGLQVNIVDVRCKTDACRVQMSYPRYPTNLSELAEITQPGVELSRQIFSEMDPVSSSGLFQVRGMFPGEPTTSELYLFRTGADGVIHTIELPHDLMIFDLDVQSPGERSEL